MNPLKRVFFQRNLYPHTHTLNPQNSYSPFPHPHPHSNPHPFAQVVELVDTQDLKSCAHRERAGSSPAPGTLSNVKCEVRSAKNSRFTFYLYTFHWPFKFTHLNRSCNG